MPETTSTTSEPEDEGSSAPSVLDFLYHDSRRVGSFLAQFEGDGQLQELTRSRTGSRGKTEGVEKDLKGDAKVVSGGRTSTQLTSVDLDVGYSRVFDPFWANARALLDFLNEHDLLKSDLGSANIGQVVIATGYLRTIDIAMLKDAWRIPSLKAKILSGVTDGKLVSQMTSAEKTAAKDLKDNTSMFIDLLQVLPHSVHASMITEDEDDPKLVWCALREEYLVTPAADLTLSNGGRVAGSWSIVGILSAFPDYGIDAPVVDDQEPGMLQSVIGMVTQQLAPVVRVALGRPAAAFGVTPLLIFRDVA